MLPLWRLFILCLCTAGIYKIYWYFRTWKFVYDREHTHINPAWGTVRMILPGLNILISYTFFLRLLRLIRKRKHNKALAIGILLLFLVSQTLFFTHAWLMGMLLMYLPIFFCQHLINQLPDIPRVSNQLHWENHERILCLLLIGIFAPFFLFYAFEMSLRTLGMTTLTIQFLRHIL